MTPPVLIPEAERLITHLQRGGKKSNWWAAGRTKQTIWWDSEAPAALLNGRHNLYFGVHPCSAIPPTNADGELCAPQHVRSQAEYIAAINCLFAEFDAKHFAGDKPAALTHIEALDPTPSVVVDSGGGYHCYWLLTDPFILASADDRARADHAQKGWVKRVGSDDGAKDLARVLRVPGTYNFKPEYAPDYPLVRVMGADLDRLYTFDELEALLPPELPAPVHDPHPVVTAAPDADYLRRWCVAALEGEREKMLAAVDGERHTRRYASAYALGGLVHAGALTDQEIFDALAVNFGPNQKNAETTIWDGIRDGKEEPRSIPEPAQPTFDADGHACCPTHRQRLIACFNGNGYRCPAPKYGDPLCFWWRGDGYTLPTEVVADDLDALDPDTLRRRLRAAIAERDRWKERAQQLELQLGHVQERNRFVTQATGAEGIQSPSMRLTFIELKKELDREVHDPEEWTQVRPAYMAACTKLSRSTVSRHLTAFEKNGLIEKDVRRVFHPELVSDDDDGWRAETFVRPKVDLSDPSKIVVASDHGGKRERCPHCQSENVAWMRVKVCRDCEKTIGDVKYEDVNPPELHDANQDADAAEQDAAGRQAAMALRNDAGESAMQHEEQDRCSSPFMLHPANQTTPPTPADNRPISSQPPASHLPAATAQSETIIGHGAAGPAPPAILDPARAPGVQRGFIAADDPWFAFNRQLAGGVMGCSSPPDPPADHGRK